MPLFMIISGFLFGKSIDKKTAFQVVKSRFASIFIPLFSWQMLMACQYIIKNSITNKSFNVVFCLKVVYSNILSLPKNMWFLWAVLLSSTLLAIIHFIFHDNIFALIFSIFLTWLIHNTLFELWFTYYPCFLIGYLVGKNYNKLQKFSDIFKKYYFVPIFILIHLLLLQVWNPRFYPCDGSENILCIYHNNQILYNLWVNVLRTVMGVVGSMVWILIFEKVARFVHNKSVCGFIQNISKNTMIYYVFSTYFLNQYMRNAERLTPSLWHWILFTIVITALCWVMAWVINKFSITRKLFAGSR